MLKIENTLLVKLEDNSFIYVDSDKQNQLYKVNYINFTKATSSQYDLELYLTKLELDIEIEKVSRDSYKLYLDNIDLSNKKAIEEYSLHKKEVDRLFVLLSLT